MAWRTITSQTIVSRGKHKAMDKPSNRKNPPLKAALIGFVIGMVAFFVFVAITLATG